MKFFAISVMLVFCSGISCLAQSKIEWQADKKLNPSDFQGPAPNSGTQQTIYPLIIIEYEVQNYQLLFSNLNETVTCSFLPLSSWLDEGNQTKRLLTYAQIQWDIQELTARMLRKSFVENRKSLGQKKMKSLYEEVTNESTRLQSDFAKETNFGTLEDKLKVWETKIERQLIEYADYCKTCKPPKKRKKKNKN